jgi:hypothetical protein
MRILITLIYSVLLGSHVMAQDSVVNIDFEVDGKQSAYKNAIVRFIYNKDTINANVKDGKLTIPEMVLKKRLIVTFYIDNYVLIFDSIPVTLNNLNPKWIVGVDKKPFDKKKFWTVKSWKKVKIIYYLDNADGRMFTVDCYKKSKVIMK